MAEYVKRTLAFARAGLGYVGSVPEEGIQLRLDRVKGRDEMHGTLTVLRTGYDGPLTKSRFNVSSATTRKSMAGYLQARSNGVDWTDLLEQFCVRAMEAEDGEGEVFVAGTQPETRRSKLLLRPFLPLNMPSILFADGGTGKSITAVAMGVTVRSGRAVIPGIVPAQTGEVLYLDWETEPWETDARVKAVCAGAGIPQVGLTYIKCRRPLTDIVERVARIVAENGVVLVILDSVALAQGTSSEGSSAEDATLRYFDALAQLGCTTLSVDHVPKNGTGKPYGSTYKGNMARATWEMVRRPSFDGRAHVTLHHRKHNTTAELPSVGLVMEWSDEAVTFWQEALVIEAEPDKPVTLRERIASEIGEAGHALDEREIASRLGVSPASVRAQVSRHASSFRRVAGGWALASVMQVSDSTDSGPLHHESASPHLIGDA